MEDREVASEFVLRALDARQWTIEDLHYAPGHPRRLVARIDLSESDDADDVEVSWVRPVPLPTSYLTAQSVLDDVTMFARRSATASKPIPIPHLPRRLSASKEIP